MTDQGASSTQPSGLPSDDHPGGPLSRAERVLLSQLKRSAMHSRTLIHAMIHVLGAIPGAQKIEAAHKGAVTALDRFCLSMKTRKQGAPFPDDEPQASAAQRPPDPVPEIERLKAENASLLESLRESRAAFDAAMHPPGVPGKMHETFIAFRKELAAAEQRAEAAEKRAADLEKQLAKWVQTEKRIRIERRMDPSTRCYCGEQSIGPPLAMWVVDGHGPWVCEPAPASDKRSFSQPHPQETETPAWGPSPEPVCERAALHDEERSAPPGPVECMPPYAPHAMVGEDCCLAFSDHMKEPPTAGECCKHHAAAQGEEK